jgi:hypothetical protein
VQLGGRLPPCAQQGCARVPDGAPRVDVIFNARGTVTRWWLPRLRHSRGLILLLLPPMPMLPL